MLQFACQGSDPQYQRVPGYPSVAEMVKVTEI
jgi:hypothetical protein